MWLRGLSLLSPSQPTYQNIIYLCCLHLISTHSLFNPFPSGSASVISSLCFFDTTFISLLSHTVAASSQSACGFHPPLLHGAAKPPGPLLFSFCPCLPGTINPFKLTYMPIMPKFLHPILTSVPRPSPAHPHPLNTSMWIISHTSKAQRGHNELIIISPDLLCLQRHQQPPRCSCQQPGNHP